MPNWMHTNASPMYTAPDYTCTVHTVFVYDRTNCMEAKKANDDWECVGASVLGPLYRAMCYIMLECRTQCHSLCTFYTHLNSSAVLNRFVAVMRCLQAIMLFSFTVTLKYCPYTLYDPSPNAKITVSSAISNLIINVLFLLKRISSRKFRKRRLLFGVFVCLFIAHRLRYFNCAYLWKWVKFKRYFSPLMMVLTCLWPLKREQIEKLFHILW